MSEVKGLIAEIEKMKYTPENQEKLIKLLDNVFDYQMNQASELLSFCQNVEHFYYFTRKNSEGYIHPCLKKAFIKGLDYLEKKYVDKFLQTYGETNEYNAKEIVFEAIDDIVYQHTYTGNNYSRDLLELQQIFGQTFDESMSQENVASQLKELYMDFETNVGEERASILVQVLAGPAVDHFCYSYLKKLNYLPRTLSNRELFWDSELTSKLDNLRVYDKQRIKFQEILIKEFYKEVNAVNEPESFINN